MPATELFKTISMSEEESKKSYLWYKNQISSLGSRVTARDLLNKEKLTGRLTIGSMYLFVYDPKHKETLPYYDTYPLVLPFSPLPDGFLGINIHYLPYLARFKLLDNLMKLNTDRKISEKSKIQLSWELLNSSSKYYSATACVKHYLKSHLKSNFLKINFTDWKTAAMLPIEGFRKQTKEKVWRDTIRKYSL
jgi:hypothetical protein